MKNIREMESEYRREQILQQLKEQRELDVRFKIPVAQYELWQGLVRKYGLDDGFLEFMLSKLMAHIIVSLMEMESFAE